MHFAPWGLDANASTLFDVVPRTVLWLGAAAIALLLAGPKLHVGPATALLIAFAGWAVASAIWSEQPLRTLSAGTGFLCTLVAIAAIHQTVGLHRALRTLAIVAGAICLASLVAGVQNLDGSLVGQPTEFGTSRLAGVTEEPGALALVAGLGIVAAIADARRLSSFVIVAVCAAALAWSQTQTVFIALGCVALLSLWGSAWANEGADGSRRRQCGRCAPVVDSRCWPQPAPCPRRRLRRCDDAERARRAMGP